MWLVAALLDSPRSCFIVAYSADVITTFGHWDAAHREDGDTFLLGKSQNPQPTGGEFMDLNTASPELNPQLSAQICCKNAYSKWKRGLH